jgi:lysophospholipase L1-like esterase
MEKLEPTRRFFFIILTFLLSIGILFIAAEELVRFLVPQETFWPISNIYQSVNTPSVSYTLKPNFQGTAFGVDLMTNHLGFRGPEWPLAKSQNTFRIALLGDSHAFGYGVPFKDTVGEKLADLLNARGDGHYEVLNFAVSAYNSQQELAVLRAYALPYHPDLVIVIASSNDDDPTPLVDQDGWLYGGFSSTTPQAPLVDESIQKIQPATASWLTKHSYLLLYLHWLKKKYQLANQSQQQRQLSNFATTQTCWLGPFPAGMISARLTQTVYLPLKTMIHEVKKVEIPIIMANFNAILDYRQLFAHLAKEEQIPTLELLTLFPEACSWAELLEQFGLGWNNHLNAAAHQRWAIALANLIVKQGYLPVQ